MTLRLLLLVTLFGWAGDLLAESFWRSLKNWVDSADIADCDTTYLHLPRQGFIGHANVYFTGTLAHINYDQEHTNQGTLNVSGNLRTRMATLLSAGVSYRGWGLSLSKDFSRHGDTEMAFSSYGQAYGLELRLHNSYSMSGTLDVSEAGSESLWDIDVDDFHQRTFLGNFYYCFNHKRFSLPAAMSHTIIQKRSSGSWLAILNYRHATSYIDDERQSFIIAEEVLDEGLMGTARYRKLSQTQVSVGGGYAYNWIFGEGHCLLHLSAMPMLSVWHRNRSYYDIEISSVSMQEPQVFRYADAIGQKLAINGTVHAGLVYNFSRYVTGVTAFANLDSFPDKENFSLYTFDWSSRFFFGVRF